MAKKPKTTNPAGSPRRILVVDDEPLVCDSIKRMLMSSGHEVEVALAAQEGLNLFDRARFDLVIIDYLLPGMKGDAMAAAIRARAGNQPIVIITAAIELLPTDGGLPAGVDAVISKPFQLEQLLETVDSVLAKHAPPG